MIKRLLSILIGAIGALEAERFVARQKARWRPSAVTGSLLDATNRALEKRRARRSEVTR